MIVRPALVASLLACATTGAAAADCMISMKPASAEGRLVRGTFQDAAGRPEIALILNVKQPVCLTGADDYDRIDGTLKIHVYATDPQVSRMLARSVGKAVSVTGKPFGEHTAHHHAPIVMDVAEIVAKREELRPPATGSTWRSKPGNPPGIAQGRQAALWIAAVNSVMHNQAADKGRHGRSIGSAKAILNATHRNGFHDSGRARITPWIVDSHDIPKTAAAPPKNAIANYSQ